MALVERVVYGPWKFAACLTRGSGRAFRIFVGTEGRRSYRSDSVRLDKAQQPLQIQPLRGYYADLLSSATPAEPPSALKTPKRAAQLLSKEDRARIVFGSRLAGSGYYNSTSDTPDATWRTINGVPVPPRPAEPDNCCMSGCVHCVWDDYRDEVEGWAVRLRHAQAKGDGGSSSEIGMQRREVADSSNSMDDDGGGSETNWRRDDADELFSSIPVGIKEFMLTEKRLRERRKREEQAGVQFETSNR